jgi:iron complex outermembrane receptor protein
MKIHIIIISLFISLIIVSFVLAQDIELDKIVVTPSRYAQEISQTATSLTVITQTDIKNSNAYNVVNILRPVSGIVVRDLYGNGVAASVDMAGFGGQAALNVLVLVDGRRVNDVDLSGVDWSQIPLDQVERIEVIRGGSGGVLYGDNASSGVINIITKKGSGKPKLNLETQYGSYDMNSQKLSLGGGIDNKFSYWFNGGREATHGYRNNSFAKANDFASKLEYSFNDALSMHFNSGLHTSTYGMPASLWQDYIDQYSRRYAKCGGDHANNKDNYYVLGAKLESSGFGGFDIDFSYRRKKTDSYFPTSKLNTKRNLIKTFGVTPKYTLGNSIFDHDNKLIGGLDYYRADYTSNNYNRVTDALLNLTGIRKNSIAGYLQNEFSILKQLVLVGGYRYESARYVFSYHDNSGGNPEIDTKVKHKQKVFNTGLVYTYMDDSNAFFNIAKSFRFPEVDEFTYNDALYQQLLNTSLKPQSAMNYQIGTRHKFSDRLKGSVSLFRMNVKNELYYDSKAFLDMFGSWAGKNTNYDKTIHEGLESSIDMKLNDWINFFGNYAFTRAYFDGGQYNKNEIPMVPRHKGSVGLRFLLPKNITFNVTGNYVGKRYFLNDQANAYSRLNGYMTLDTNLSWRSKDLTVTFGINNILNKKYSEYAGVVVDSAYESCSGINWPAGSKFYYPSPERNFSLKLEYKF